MTDPADLYREEDCLPLSALQHLLFCERQCALIHVEGLWAENRLTVEGRHLHDRVDAAGRASRGGMRVARGLPIRSLRLGLAGRADAVEFHPNQVIFPVEYKRGRPKRDDSDRVQLCAQALCLEEMLAAPVPAGALYYGRTRRRLDVRFDEALRERTAAAARRLHELVASGRTPAAVREPKCESCSLLHLCLPEAVGRRGTAARYFESALARALASDVDPEGSL
ncbi:MAG: CRISPR-associated protein Cas4 [Gemmatimonadales bacterium]